MDQSLGREFLGLGEEPGVHKKSKDKTLLQRLAGPKKATIKLTRLEKNHVLDMARPLIDTINQFIFDFNRYGKTLPEREYSKAMLTCGSFNENLEKVIDLLSYLLPC